VLNIEIRRPRIEDTNELNLFFEKVIIDTFTEEGIGEKFEDIEAEIESKKKYLVSDFASNGANRYFLLAWHTDKIVGSIEYGPASDLICKCTKNAFNGLPEVGTVFVLPEYQKMGIGRLLLNSIYSKLQNKGIEKFCLDSGYVRAQHIWKKKFGEPDYLLKDYWGEGFDHMIWKIKISDLTKRIN
jgi:GNAT superfamily N-acetyltransferase